MTRNEMEQKTIASLRSLAKANGLRLRPTLKKKEIVDLLLSLFPDEQPATEIPSRIKIQAKPGPQKKKEKAAELAGHAGEGEVHDEKVILNPSPTPQEAARPPYSEIPKEYGENRIVLLVRDPEWLHAYWEVTPDALGDAKTYMESDAHVGKIVIKL